MIRQFPTRALCHGPTHPFSRHMKRSYARYNSGESDLRNRSWLGHRFRLLACSPLSATFTIRRKQTCQHMLSALRHLRLSCVVWQYLVAVYVVPHLHSVCCRGWLPHTCCRDSTICPRCPGEDISVHG